MAVNVLLGPEDPALSSLMDVWLRGGERVFSASWFPSRIWLPPRVVLCKFGDWHDLGRVEPDVRLRVRPLTGNRVTNIWCAEAVMSPTFGTDAPTFGRERHQHLVVRSGRTKFKIG